MNNSKMVSLKENELSNLNGGGPVLLNGRYRGNNLYTKMEDGLYKYVAPVVRDELIGRAVKYLLR
ncbi:hypothetical protein [Clostridium botulinum]|uniref:hypothetical protein n=1 Tax=Clostridium botulinum TaxID=1491 RepID=UPI003DA3FA01